MGCLLLYIGLFLELFLLLLVSDLFVVRLIVGFHDWKKWFGSLMIALYMSTFVCEVVVSWDFFSFDD